MRIIVLLFTLVSFSQCNNQSVNNSNIYKQTFFDSIEKQNILTLKSYNAVQLNDSAKWFLYLSHFNDSCSSGRAQSIVELRILPIAYCKISLSYVRRRGDTLSLLYNFLYNDSLIVEKNSQGEFLTDGLIFNLKTNKLIGFVKGEAHQYETFQFFDDYERQKSLQATLFFRKYKDSLNSWLRDEVNRRGF